MTYQRFTAMFLLAANLSACAVESGTSSTRQAATTTTEPTCADDPNKALKRKLELRRMALGDEIEAAESEIKSNDITIAENAGTIAAITDFLGVINDGYNYPQTDPAKESYPGRKHLVEQIEDIGKFPASAVGKFGLFSLVAALEAITLKAGGKAVAKRLCASTVIREAEKAALTEAAKKASTKALGMVAKYWKKFGRAKLVIGGIGAIALPMKARWDLKGDGWETWVPVAGTLKIGGENLGIEFGNWIARDDIKKALESDIADIDAEIKSSQDTMKKKTEESATLEKANVKHLENIKKWKAELAKVNAALAKLGGGNTCSACDPTDLPEPDGDVLAVETKLVLDPSTVEDETYDAWTLESLLAGIDLSDAATALREFVIRDEFFECDADGVCTPL